MGASNSVFISYRRDLGFAWAQLVWDDLSSHDIDAFLDLESLQEAGAFDDKILHQIAARPYFVPVLLPGSLERCVEPDDWLLREIEYAVSIDRAVVPLVVGDFDFEEADRCLPEHIAHVLRSSNGVGFVPEYYHEGMRRLRDERLKPIDRPVRTLSHEDREFAAAAQVRAGRAATTVQAGTSEASAAGPSEPTTSRRVRVIAVVGAALTLILGGALIALALQRGSTPEAGWTSSMAAPVASTATETDGPAATNASPATPAASPMTAQPATSTVPTTTVWPPVGCAEGSPVVFCDSFDGSALDPAMWSVFENEGSVEVSGGELLLSSSGRSFPFILARTGIPASGPYRLTIRFRFTEAGEYGTGFKAQEGFPENGRSVDPVDERLTAKVWQDKEAEFVIETECTSLPMRTDIASHVVVFEDDGSGRVRAWLDEEEMSACAGSRRPDTLWLGNPTAPLEDCDCAWTSVAFDLVRVDREW
jgi:hypothetical protein